MEAIIDYLMHFHECDARGLPKGPEAKSQQNGAHYICRSQQTQPNSIRVEPAIHHTES